MKTIQKNNPVARVRLDSFNMGEHFVIQDNQDGNCPCILLHKIKDGTCFFYNYVTDSMDWLSKETLVVNITILPESEIVWQYAF
jgi:hypothetical protein